MKNEIPIDWIWTFKICIVWFTVGFDSLIKFLKRKKNFEGTHGFEPWTYRTAADCSTTELYPLLLSFGMSLPKTDDAADI